MGGSGPTPRESWWGCRLERQLFSRVTLDAEVQNPDGTTSDLPVVDERSFFNGPGFPTTGVPAKRLLMTPAIMAAMDSCSL